MVQGISITIQRTAGILRKTVSEVSGKREDHYIAGLSMGGGGAMWVGLQKPEQYGTICMLSTGGIAPLEGLWRSKSGDDTFYRKCNEDIYGTPDSDSLAGTEYDILKLFVRQQRSIRLFRRYIMPWEQRMSVILWR